MAPIQEQCYPENRFGGYSRVDGTVAFYTRVQALLRGAGVVVDVGCGRGVRAEDPCAFRRGLADLRSSGRTVIGLDVSAAGENNPMIDVFHRIEEGKEWPVDSSTVDVVVCDFVLEHLKDPTAFFGEVHRILNTGGYFCARTPNKWGYVALISRLMPAGRHGDVVTKVQSNRKEEDVFPKFYRCNTSSEVRRSLTGLGMRVAIVPSESEPNYFAFNSTLYRCGVVLHRLLPDFFKSTLLIFAEK